MKDCLPSRAGARALIGARGDASQARRFALHGPPFSPRFQRTGHSLASAVAEDFDVVACSERHADERSPFVRTVAVKLPSRKQGNHDAIDASRRFHAPVAGRR